MVSNRKILTFNVVALVLLGTLVCVLVKSSAVIQDKTVPILMYHGINDVPVGIPELSVYVDEFDKQMEYLALNGYTAIDLDEIDECSKYEKPVIITLDDGYMDNYTYAYPILKKYGLKATLFMIAEQIDREGHLTTEQMAVMGDIITFQSHTIDHKQLTEMTAEQVEKEFSESKAILEGVTGKPIYAVSYPEGLYNQEIAKAASKYYDYAVTTKRGNNTMLSDKFQLKRISVSRTQILSDFILKLNEKGSTESAYPSNNGDG